jgi:segregation and condensation protein A
VELKARRLLPDLGDAELDEELLRFEARDLLLARLLECKTFKDAADRRRRPHRPRRSQPAPHRRPEEPFRSLVPDPLDRVTLAQLAAAARARSRAKPEAVVDTDHVAPVRASVRDAVESCSTAAATGAGVVQRARRRAGERVEAVVRFLAVLELYKQGVVELDQVETFGTLTVTRLAETVVARRVERRRLGSRRHRRRGRRADDLDDGRRSTADLDASRSTRLDERPRRRPRAEETV